MCFLMDGTLKLLCAEQCPAFLQVEAMFQEYKRHRLESHLSVIDFFQTKVKTTGARIYQAA
jgi:hypothetical protein